MTEILNTVFLVISNLLEWIFNFISSIFPQERKTIYDADFLPSSELLSSFNKGFSINGKSLTLETSYKNVLVTGQTGSGKSTCISIPSCLKMIGNASLCINDPSGEIAENVSGAFKRAGYDVQIINYTKPEYGGYNPLKRIKTKSDISKISELIIFNALGRGKDPFWNISATNCLSIFIELVCTLAEEQKTMHTVVSLINTYTYNPEQIDSLIVRAKNAALLSEYKVFNSYDSKIVQGIIASIKAALKIFSDPQVALATSYDSVSFEHCRKKPTIIFFNNNVTSMKYYGLITAIFFEQFFAEILSRIPDKKELPVFFLIDEAASLYLSSLQITIANIRKVRAGIMAIFQSYHQIVNLYGAENAKSIVENCFTAVYLPGQPLDVSRDISATLGSFEFEDEHGHRHTRLLLTPDEVRQLDESLLLCGNRRAIKLPMKFFYKNYSLRSLSQISPFVPGNKLPSPSLSSIDILCAK